MVWFMALTSNGFVNSSWHSKVIIPQQWKQLIYKMKHYIIYTTMTCHALIMKQPIERLSLQHTITIIMINGLVDCIHVQLTINGSSLYGLVIELQWTIHLRSQTSVICRMHSQVSKVYFSKLCDAKSVVCEETTMY